jgi:hypothetical protein
LTSGSALISASAAKRKRSWVAPARALIRGSTARGSTRWSNSRKMSASRRTVAFSGCFFVSFGGGVPKVQVAGASAPPAAV